VQCSLVNTENAKPWREPRPPGPDFSVGVGPGCTRHTVARSHCCNEPRPGCTWHANLCRSGLRISPSAFVILCDSASTASAWPNGANASLHAAGSFGCCRSWAKDFGVGSRQADETTPRTAQPCGRCIGRLIQLAAVHLGARSLPSSWNTAPPMFRPIALAVSSMRMMASASSSAIRSRPPGSDAPPSPRRSQTISMHHRGNAHRVRLEAGAVESLVGGVLVGGLRHA
jgi:hypothetical protein